MSLASSKQIIGRATVVDFPDLNIYSIPAKIDTGAYFNTLHCTQIGIRAGKLCFRILNEQEHCFEEFSQRRIKNSFGQSEMRYMIRTRIRIAGRTIKSIISLTDRTSMRYPVLIGRRLLKNKFIIDVSIKN